jgi:exodeoxyribonuclease V beta subunit
VSAATTNVNAWTDLDLAVDGRISIEASAGTGKTWTIAALYLRLVLERGLGPRQIVVTTFTEAAAQELRERLRGALLLAEREAAATAAAPPTEAGLGAGYEAWLHARWRADDDVRNDDLRRLRVALSQLDIAPIGTLHGLCRRILADHPFASATEFALPELVSGEAVLDEVVGDLWRILRQGDTTTADLQTLVASGVADDIDALRRAVELLLRPGMSVAAAARSMQIDDAAEWAERLRRIADAPKMIAANADALRLRKCWLALAAWLAGETQPVPCELVAGLKLVRKDDSFLKDGRASRDAAEARAFILQRVIPVLEAARLRGLSALAELARARLRATLSRRNQMRFDDLLLRVAEALAGDASGSQEPSTRRGLADALHAAWPVALVDEFQDTDDVQFGILDAVYRDARSGQRGLLVMIGDPKQAIYRFRGGDIDAYREAVAGARQRLTLRINRRSSRALVAAINELYAVGGEELSAVADKPAIRYVTVDASDRCDAKPYTIGGEAVSRPLVIHHSDDPPGKVGQRRTAALTQCADEIVRMLQSGEHRIGDRVITPADIAVLVPRSKDIVELRDLLRVRRVPCATSDPTSVFRTDIARELQIVLHAVANAGDLGALRAAAATRLWGASFIDLQRYGDDVEQWETIANRFHAWNGVWNERGVLAVIERLLDSMAVRYLQTSAGERAITDLRHLGELLQAEDDVVSGKEELLAWFMRQRSAAVIDDSSEAVEAAQLRIESDGDRVRVMTLHLSKGLEFPIVFLPLMGEHTEHPMRAELCVVHADSGRQVDVSDAAREEELCDLQDERFRVLYVALTRAIHACHVHAFREVKAARGHAGAAFTEMLKRMTPRLGEAGDATVPDALADATPHIDWRAGWKVAALPSRRPASADAEPRVRIARKPPPASTRALEARHSFTTLTQFAHAGLETDSAAADEIDIDRSGIGADEDAASAVAVEQADLAAHPELARLTRVRGADFGNAIHAVLERRVVGEPLARQGELVARCLEEARVRRRELSPDALAAAVIARLDGALAAPLGLEHAPQLRLADVAARNQRAEMDFHFVIDDVAMSRLARICAQHGEPELVPKSHAVLSGLMTGKIDLIFRHASRFHVLDYKGNHLGDELNRYAGASLRAAMDANHYRFQALIYTIATDRYLRQRLASQYERSAHLGECVYLFVRAAGLSADAGIWRHRFDDELLDAVDGVLAGAIGEAA